MYGFKSNFIIFKIHGLIMPIIILPLFLPILIFGIGALNVLIFNGFEDLYIRQIALLAGISGLSMALCPIASSYIIKANYLNFYSSSGMNFKARPF